MFRRVRARYTPVMTRLTRTAAAGAAIAGGVAASRLLTARRRPSARRGPRRWHVITVLRPLTEVSENLPDLFAKRPGALEVEVRPAPGDKGTEIAVRAVDPAVPDGDVRRALRESRSLLEVGEVLEPGGPTTIPTPLNRPLRAMTRRGREEGLL